VPSRQCPKCSSSMSEGFVADRTHHSAAAVPSWVEGEPERSVWTGLKLSGRSRFDIATWRCTRCGFLEQYASDGPSQHDAAQKQVQRVVLIVAIVVAVVAAIAAGLVSALVGR
jgi:hypothetical protein